MSDSFESISFVGETSRKRKGKKKGRRKKNSQNLTLRRGLPAELRRHRHDGDGQADPVCIAEAQGRGERGDDAGEGRAERQEVRVIC